MAVRSAGNEWPTTSLATAVRDAVAPRSVARGSLGLLIKFSADLASACAASVVGLFWAHERGFPMPPIWMMACYAPMVLVIFAARSTYRRKLHNTLVGEFMAVQTTAALAAMLLLAGMVLTGVPGDLSDTITKVWLTTAFFLPAGRIAAILVTRSLRRHSHLQSPTLILGNGAIAYHLAKRFLDNPQFGILPVGLVDSDSPWTGAGGHDCPIPAVGTPATMAEAIQNTRAEAVVVAFSQARDEDLIPAIRAARLAGLTVWVVPRMFDTVGLRANGLRGRYAGDDAVQHQPHQLAVRGQAHPRSRARRRHPDGHFPSVRLPHGRRQSFLAGIDVLSTTKDRPRWNCVRLLEVSLDAPTPGL